MNEFVLKGKPKFELGNVVCTRGVHNDICEDESLFTFVATSLCRYAQCDWGDTDKEDCKINDAAVKGEDRILAVYKKADTTIWIITEWDRSVTTILYPEEY